MERHAQCGGSEPSIHRFQNDVRLGARCVASSEMGSQKKTSGPSPGEMQKGAPVPSSPKASSPRRVLLPVAQASLVTADQLGHGPDDEPLAWFIEYAVAGEVKGADLAGEGRPELSLSLGITESGKAWPGRTDGSHRQLRGQHSNPGRRHGPSLPPAAQPANRHTIRGTSGCGARKPCRFSSDRLYLKRLHRPPYSWGESPSSQRQDHGLHRGAWRGSGG
jgi:hypothetical protein